MQRSNLAEQKMQLMKLLYEAPTLTGLRAVAQIFHHPSLYFHYSYQVLYVILMLDQVCSPCLIWCCLAQLILQDKSYTKKTA